MNKELVLIAIIPMVIVMIFLMKCHLELPIHYLKLKAGKELRRWRKTTATIVDLQRGSGSRGNYPWIFKYEFLDQEEKQVEQKCVVSRGREISYSVNDSIAVWYHHEDSPLCMTEMELSDVGFLDKKTGELKSEQEIRRSLLLDAVIVVFTAVAFVVADSKISYTRGAAILYYLFVACLLISLGLLQARKLMKIHE